MNEWIWETPDWEESGSRWATQIAVVAGGEIPVNEVIDFYDQVWDSNAAGALWLLEGDPIEIAACISAGEDPTMIAPDLSQADPLLAVALELEPILSGKADSGACMHDGGTDWDQRLLDLHSAIEWRIAITSFILKDE